MKTKFVNLIHHYSHSKQKNVFIGKTKVCPMREFSGAVNESGFDGNTLLIECENNEYV